jgi:CHAT domain-containing protein
MRRHAALCGVLLVIACTREPETQPRLSEIDEFLRFAPSASRTIEARVAGTRWAPVRKSSGSVDQLEFEGRAGAILAHPNAKAQHLYGVASLMMGRANESRTALEEAAAAPRAGAREWNDLSAARYEIAAAGKDASLLPLALTAADRALQFSASYSPAHFNRALILTRLGLRNEAKREWKTAIDAETDKQWRDEARRRLTELDIAPLAPVETELDLALRRTRAGDDRTLHATVASRIEEIRTQSETIMISAWADAAANHDDHRATQLLDRLRRAGDLLAVDDGDYLLRDAVHAIDATPPRAIRALVAAHLAYRDARLQYANQLAGSDVALDRTAKSLARAHSPLQYVARYYAANATFDRNRVDAARKRLEGVLDDIHDRHYRSLDAGVSKQLGMYYGYRGMWTAALIQLERSYELFNAGGEQVNAAFTEAIIGEVYDRIGQFEKAWRHRTAALDVLTRSVPDQRSLAVLGGAVHAEILRRDYESALSLLVIARQEAEVVGDTILTAEMIIRQARVLLAAHGKDDAKQALQRASGFIDRISDPRQRRRVAADAAIVEGESAEPCAAIAILTPSIELYEENGFRMQLPAAYLARGRARLACGNSEGALSDFRKGMAELERQRANVAVDIRVTLFDTVPDLLAETVDLLLSRGRDAEAYAVVERARARTLIEALGLRHSATQQANIARIASALPANAALIEYALLPHGVAAFCITRRGMNVTRLRIEPAELRSRVAELGAMIETRKPLADVQRAACDLHAALIAPLDILIANADLLYIVPDRFLYAAPFAAFRDASTAKYLIERHRLVIAPSGAFVLRRLAPRATRGRPLIISEPRSDGQWLPAAQREAAGVERLYAGASHLHGPSATIERFVAEARLSSMIHYAGHAGIDDAGGGFLPLAPSAANDGRLDASAISHLSLRRTRLVVLSACATMRGTASRVEGMPSVSRAFLAAGAPLVLGMLWEIEDDTARPLLLSFHARLRSRRHINPSTALQETQCDLLRSSDPAVSHPASWAAASLIGVD